MIGFCSLGCWFVNIGTRFLRSKPVRVPLVWVIDRLIVKLKGKPEKGTG